MTFMFDQCPFSQKLACLLSSLRRQQQNNTPSHIAPHTGLFGTVHSPAVFHILDMVKNYIGPIIEEWRGKSGEIMPICYNCRVSMSKLLDRGNSIQTREEWLCIHYGMIFNIIHCKSSQIYMHIETDISQANF